VLFIDHASKNNSLKQCKNYTVLCNLSSDGMLSAKLHNLASLPFTFH